MILAFMIVCSYSILICRVFKNKCKSYLFSNVFKESEIRDNDWEIAYDGKTYWEEGEFKFCPPVFVQRYIVVQDLLKQLGPFKKVVDLGCSKFGFFPYLKQLEGVEEILLIDQDESLLQHQSPVLQPIPIDYLKPKHRPLTVKVLYGNAAVPDSSLADSSAVVAIELIEHMFPPDLDELPYTIFGIVQPQIVIITTPNYDFNTLFKLNEFRHWDHKFEWTRRQFKDWVENIVLRFPNYSSKLYGVGPGPDGTSQYGTCTQMVVFHHNSSTPKCNTRHLYLENLYHDILEINYPYEPEVEITLEQHVKYSAEKFIHYAVNCEEYYVDDQIEIPLSSIMRMVTRHSDSRELLQAVLESGGWTVEENKAVAVKAKRWTVDTPILQTGTWIWI